MTFFLVSKEYLSFIILSDSLVTKHNLHTICGPRIYNIIINNYSSQAGEMITDRGATVVVYGEIINPWVRLPKDKPWVRTN